MSEATFAVLGPLETRGRRTPIQLGGSKPRAILGTLLLQPGGFVSVDVLTEVLWPSRPPSSAVANIRTYVNGLRKVLTAGGVGGDCVRTEPLGYRLVAPDQEVDAVVFDHLLKQARTQRAAGDDQSALDSCEQALGLWRGGVLEDLAPSVVWDPIVVRLEELRASAAEERLDLQLRLGHYETLVAELRSRLAGDPLREDLWRILVHALHQTGRAGEARAAYAEAVGVLAVELGAEPGKALRAAGELVGIRATEFRDNQSRHTSMPICQLPLDTPDFTGRETIVSSLEQLLRSADRSPTVAVLFGAPGVGKTTLAVHLAHRVRDAFPDGQLYVEMSGSSDVCREPADVLAELL
ncbi:MAG: BTAD domain-containing putative transcriptional regulator, partial [Micromonosporaceae bacterium]